MAMLNGLTGQLLIAAPDLHDGNFSRSVVLMLQHSLQGAMGVVLNQPSDFSVGQVWEEVADTQCDCNDPVNVGGPVEGPLVAIHESIAMSEQTVLEGVYFSMARENLNRIVANDELRFRLYSGYSGWGPGQLESEIEQGGWMTLDATAEHVFGEEESLWRYVCEHVGQEVIKPHVGRLAPSDPSLN
jgi:putative transcriptional regulator